MMKYIQFGSKITPWIAASLCSLLIAVALNAFGLFMEKWGQEVVNHREYLVVENKWIVVPDYNVLFGMINVCNTTHTLNVRKEWQVETSCFRSNQLNEAWIQMTQGLLILGAVCAVASICASVAFAIVSCKSEKNKSVVAVIIPTSLIAALFNLIAVVTSGTSLSARGANVDLSLILVCCAVIFYIIAGLLAIADMQHLCVKKRPAIGKGLVRPI